AANDTLTSQDRNFLQMEIDNLKDSINRIADTTQFNTKFILDGSSCGKCESTETTTKGYIKGAIDIEGNYKIQVRAKPGQAQVQKSTIFKVCNENVVTNPQLNANNGIGNVAIDNLPAGDYNITATQAGGGTVTTTYDSSLIGKVTEANTSGLAETMTLTFTDKDGNTATKEISLSANANTQQLAAAEIVSQLDGTTIKINDIDYALAATDNGNGTYSITSTGNESAIQSMKSSAPVLDIEPSTKLSASSNNTYTKTFYTDTLTFTVSDDGIKSGTQMTFTFSALSYYLEDDTNPKSALKSLSEQVTDTITFAQDYTKEEAAQYLKDYFHTKVYSTATGKNLTLSGDVSANSPKFTLTTSVFSNSSDAARATNVFVTSVDQNGASISPISSTHTYSSDVKELYSYNYGTVSNGNDNSVKEKITLTFHDQNSGTESSDPNTGEAYTKDTIGAMYNSSDDYWYKYQCTDTIEIEVAPGATKSEIAAKIKEAVNNHKKDAADSKASLNFSKTNPNGTTYERTLNITGSVTGTNNESYRIETDIFSADYFGSTGRYPYLVANVTVEADAAGSTTASSDTGYPKEINTAASSALISESQFYCSEEAAESISLSVNANTQNNASMIFEVTDKTYDQAAGGYILTLSASSNVLTADGNTARYSNEKIIISTGNKTVNIGALLGEDESHMSMTLDPENFEVGNKFVYNVSGNGTTTTPVTTSLYMSHQQDAKWPQAWEWEEPYETTYLSSGSYFNVNAEAVSNREIHFRNFYLNTENGNVIDSDIKLAFNEDFGKRASLFPDAPEDPWNRSSEISLASFTSNYQGKVADGSTKLRDLDQFYNKSGVFMLEEPQKITITQNDGKKAQITLYGTDTLNDVAKKLNDAIADDLGQGMYVRGGDVNKIVTFVENPTEGTGLETVEGTFVIRSLIPGTAGELTFSSPYGELISNLGLNTVQNSDEGFYDVSVSNAHTGEIITGNAKIMGNVLRGVIHENIDVEFDPMAGVSAVWSEDDKNFILVPDEKPYTTFLHVVKNNISFHIGANEGEKIQLDIGDMTAAGLGLKSVSVTTAG
ncbi:MAG: hypothetical protein SPL87_06930, partial [Synergistales bacterium]|nr:hypothetical protein [Synergistales bacterium]